MTDRHAGYIVILERDLRDDDAEAVIAALRMVKGVSRVTPVVAEAAQFIYTTRRDVEWRAALGKLAAEGPGDKRGSRDGLSTFCPQDHPSDGRCLAPDGPVSGPAGDLAAAALRLSMALGGARVTLECPLTTAEADALAEALNEGLADGDGPAWAVESLTVAAGDPPRVAAIKITVAVGRGPA